MHKDIKHLCKEHLLDVSDCIWITSNCFSKACEHVKLVVQLSHARNIAVNHAHELDEWLANICKQLQALPEIVAFDQIPDMTSCILISTGA